MVCLTSTLGVLELLQFNVVTHQYYKFLELALTCHVTFQFFKKKSFVATKQY